MDFDCPFGPADIIRDREEGLLVPPEDVAALTEALELLISNPDRRKRMGENARKITERFGLEKVMGQWEQMIKDLR